MTLFEAADSIGGQFNMAKRIPGKQELVIQDDLDGAGEWHLRALTLREQLGAVAKAVVDAVLIDLEGSLVADVADAGIVEQDVQPAKRCTTAGPTRGERDFVSPAMSSAASCSAL